MAENNMVPGQRANALFSMLNQFGQRLDQTEQLLQSQKDAAAKFAQQKELVDYEYGKRAEVEKIQAVSGLNKELLKTQAEIEKENSERLQAAVTKSQEMIQSAAEKTSSFKSFGGSARFLILPKLADVDKDGRNTYTFSYSVSTDGSTYQPVDVTEYSALLSGISEASKEAETLEAKTVKSAETNFNPSKTEKGVFYAGRDKAASDHFTGIFKLDVNPKSATEYEKLTAMLSTGRTKLGKIIPNTYNMTEKLQNQKLDREDKNAGLKDPKPLTKEQQDKLISYDKFKIFTSSHKDKNSIIPITLGEEGGTTLSVNVDLKQKRSDILIQMSKSLKVYNDTAPDDKKLTIINGNLVPVIKSGEDLETARIRLAADSPEESKFVDLYNSILNLPPNFNNQPLDSYLNLDGTTLQNMFSQPQQEAPRDYSHPGINPGG